MLDCGRLLAAILGVLTDEDVRLLLVGLNTPDTPDPLDTPPSRREPLHACISDSTN